LAYIDNAGLLRSLTTQLSESTAAAGALTIDETLDFSDYGEPVTVTAPPAGQVVSIQQLLQGTGTAGSASS
jgi:hypothetical protein